MIRKVMFPTGQLLVRVFFLLLLNLNDIPCDANANTSSRPSANAIGIDVDSGILKRVKERLDDVMGVPLEAIKVLETFHKYDGFRPHGLHAAGRDRVLTFLYSLIQSFDNLKLYFGTEAGEYFTYISSDAVYREPGNSGYLPDDPEMSKYWPICVNGTDGAQQNCQMATGSSYIQCIDDCHIVPCPDAESQQIYNGTADCITSPSLSPRNTSSGSQEECEARIKWCPSYTSKEVPETAVLGFVPVGYHCFDKMGMFSQTPGEIARDSDGEPPYAYNGTCKHWDETPVTRVTPGSFAHSIGDDNNNNGTYGAGLMRTIDYDPRLRPWYIDTKKQQKENWSRPYPFSTHSNIITKIGITVSTVELHTLRIHASNITDSKCIHFSFPVLFSIPLRPSVCGSLL